MTCVAIIGLAPCARRAASEIGDLGISDLSLKRSQWLFIVLQIRPFVVNFPCRNVIVGLRVLGLDFFNQSGPLLEVSLSACLPGEAFQLKIDYVPRHHCDPLANSSEIFDSKRGRADVHNSAQTLNGLIPISLLIG
jgi:hypothetical protein